MSSQSTLNTSEIVFPLSKTAQPFSSKNNHSPKIKPKKRKSDKRTTPTAKRFRPSSKVNRYSESDSEQSDKENKPPTDQALQTLYNRRRGKRTRRSSHSVSSGVFPYSSGDTTPVNEQAGSQDDQAARVEPDQVKLNVQHASACVLTGMGKAECGTAQPSKAHTSNAVESPHPQNLTASLDDRIALLITRYKAELSKGEKKNI